MPMFSYPAMPMYSQDQAAYIQQMYDWHTKMVQYQDQKKAYHMEQAKHFQNMLTRIKAAKTTEESKDGAA